MLIIKILYICVASTYPDSVMGVKVAANKPFTSILKMSYGATVFLATVMGEARIHTKKDIMRMPIVKKED